MYVKIVANISKNLHVAIPSDTYFLYWDTVFYAYIYIDSRIAREVLAPGKFFFARMLQCLSIEQLMELMIFHYTEPKCVTFMYY